MTETFPRFAPGQIVATPGALSLLEQHGVSPDTILRRHLAGDWGCVCSDDAALNDEAVRRFQYIWRIKGIDSKLKAKGIKEGDTVHIGEMEFEYRE